MIKRNQYTQKVRNVTEMPTHSNSPKEAGNAPQKTRGIANIEEGM
jgi:hypothetical protein